jgi:dUTP pyrophosphatase
MKLTRKCRAVSRVPSIEEQLRGIPEKIGNILERYPGAVFLPCFYRATPPRIFFKSDSARIVARRGDTVLNPDGLSYDLLANGYHILGEGVFYISYEWPPEGAFEFDMRGCLLEKKLDPGDLDEEVRRFCMSLGIFDVLPLLRFERVATEGKRPVTLRIKKLRPDIEAPEYAHTGDAGLDIRSAEDLELPPGERYLVGTGFAMALPAGYAAFVQPRSGLAARQGISIANTPGLIDCHYRGEVKVILINLGQEPFKVRKGDRIAQMVIQAVESARVEVVGELDDTARGAGGFGSTGL